MYVGPAFVEVSLESFPFFFFVEVNLPDSPFERFLLFLRSINCEGRSGPRWSLSNKNDSFFRVLRVVGHRRRLVVSRSASDIEQQKKSQSAREVGGPPRSSFRFSQSSV